MIEVKNISLIINGGKKILENISFTVKKNEHWILLGRNGSGKSKLLEIICGYTRQSTGEVIRFGDPSPDLRKIRKRIGYVASYLNTQAAHYHSVINIVLGGYFGSIGLYDEITPSLEERAMNLLQLSGLKNFENRLYCTLSDGEKQRVLSARAFMVDPEIVIFDEPCSGLDILSREMLLDSLENVLSSSGASLIYVTHHVEEITPLFTHFALIMNGRFLDSGRLKDEALINGINRMFDNRVVIEKHAERWYSRVAG
ncbi:MAG: ATP-binding cassette domain-containing protein [Spirochaetes bacterium]|nr:ATP-binding cassette domain-containing protein [Spirochaetota bacterium]